MSTVHIRLKDIFDVAVACHVIFYPGDTPFFNGSALAVSGPHSILIDADGEGSVTLLPGRYTVRFAKITGNTDTLIILVPDEEGTYELQDLVCAGDWVLPFRDFLKKSQNLADVADKADAFAEIKQPASETASGVVELATQAEVDAGTDGTKAVTPATLANFARWSSLHPKLKLVSVANAVQRLGLAPGSLNLGDWVEQTDTHAVYQVIDPVRPALETSYVKVGARTMGETSAPGGLLAEWLFTPGSELLDTSGNGNHLSNVNGVTFAVVDGLAAAVFTGTGDELDSAPILPGSALTIAFFAKSSATSGYVQALDWGKLSAYTHHDNSGTPAWNYTYGSYAPVSTGSTAWRFMFARYDGAEWTFGCDESTVTASDDGPQTEASVQLGHGFSSDMHLAKVRIWNRALTDAELSQIRNS